MIFSLNRFGFKIDVQNINVNVTHFTRIVVCRMVAIIQISVNEKKWYPSCSKGLDQTVEHIVIYLDEKNFFGRILTFDGNFHLAELEEMTSSDEKQIEAAQKVRIRLLITLWFILTRKNFVGRILTLDGKFPWQNFLKIKKFIVSLYGICYFSLGKLKPPVTKRLLSNHFIVK